MLDTIEKPLGAELELGQPPSKRELIEKELRADPSRSDREIARACNVDHKTVGNVRGKIVPIPSPPVSPAACPPPPGVVDKPKYDPFDPKEGDMVIPHQPAIAVYENTSGAVVIIQCSDDPDQDDPIILVRPEHVEKLIARLRKVAKEAVGS
jgi:hypothetical protein